MLSTLFILKSQTNDIHVMKFIIRVQNLNWNLWAVCKKSYYMYTNSNTKHLLTQFSYYLHYEKPEHVYHIPAWKNNLCSIVFVALKFVTRYQLLFELKPCSLFENMFWWTRRVQICTHFLVCMKHVDRHRLLAVNS